MSDTDSPPDPRAWFALYVRSRQERVVDRSLQKLGLETYLPLREVVRKWSDRKKVIQVPYFASYVFVHCTEEERQDCWNVRGAIRFLGAQGRATSIDPAELAAIRDALTRLVPFEPYPKLTPGQLVVVKAGALKGLTGVLVRKQKHYRFVIQIKAMGQGISAEIDAVDVEPA